MMMSGQHSPAFRSLRSQTARRRPSGSPDSGDPVPRDPDRVFLLIGQNPALLGLDLDDTLFASPELVVVAAAAGSRPATAGEALSYGARVPSLAP